MVIIIDPQIAGASGDMILCSLVDMNADKTKIIDGIKSCSKFLPDSIIHEINFTRINKNKINSTSLVLKKTEEITERTGTEIKEAISSSVNTLNLSNQAKQFAESCIDSLICAESKIHGTSVDTVHLHESSSIDTLVDIVGVAIAMDDLNLFDEEILCMPIAVGSGTVTFSHGTMSNPASAILEIFKGSSLTICGSQTKDELTTPTGASILKNLTSHSINYYPTIKVKSIGYGAGTKSFESFSNVLKIIRADTSTLTTESIKVVETNVDDVSGEYLGNLIQKITKQAKDVSIYPGITKKNRPTHLIRILSDESSLDDVIDILVKETGTLGIRINDTRRITLPRIMHKDTIHIRGKSFDVRYKTSSYKEDTYLKIEFDDLQNISNLINKSLKETEYLIRKEIKDV